MMLALLLQLFTDGYRTIPLAELATTRWTHVCVVGPVVYVRRMKDGDIHATIDDGKTKVVLELIPQIPLSRPKKSTTIKACGISRFDRHHKWAELHPVIKWELMR